MRASFVSAAFLAFVSAAFAQTAGFDAITAPTKDQTLTVGSTFDIIWEPGTVTGTVSIVLLEGATPGTLDLGPTLASGVSNVAGKYSWTIAPSVGSFATYGIKIQLDSNPSTFQYSNPFFITGGSSSASVSASKSTSSASASGTASGSLTASTSTKTVTLSHGTGFTSSTPTVSASQNSTITSPSSVPTSKGSSNGTLSTTLTVTTTPSGHASSTPSKTGAVQTVSPNAAAANVASGGLALLGGLAIALFM